MKKAITDIEAELEERIKYFKAQEMYLEAQRIEQRGRYDLEMMKEVGYCRALRIIRGIWINVRPVRRLGLWWITSRPITC